MRCSGLRFTKHKYADLWKLDARQIKEDHVFRVREAVFGLTGNKPGDRNFRKKLEGKEMMRWYFPSKYNFPDFRIDEYFEMQAERFTERTPHSCMSKLRKTMKRASTHREALRLFFKGLDEATFLSNPTLQDLHSLFRFVDPDSVLTFAPMQDIFREHPPLGWEAPPFQAKVNGLWPRDLYILWQMLKDRLGPKATISLQPAITRAEAVGKVREIVLKEIKRINAVLSLEDTLVLCEEEDQRPVEFASRTGSFAEVGAPEKAMSPLIGPWQLEGGKGRLIISKESDTFRLQYDLARNVEIRGMLAMQDDWAEADLVKGDSPYGRVCLQLGKGTSTLNMKLKMHNHETWGMLAAHRPADFVPSTKPEAADLGTAQSEANRAGIGVLAARGRRPARRLLASYLAQRPSGRGPGRAGRVDGAPLAAPEGAKGPSSAPLPDPLRGYLCKRHRFVDPMFRRRRLKWLERQMAEKNKDREVKFNLYYTVHPDDRREWPTNKGSVTVQWPSPYH